MKATIALFALALVALHFSFAAAEENKYEEHRSPDGKYTYKTVAGDPLKARIYKLYNGLTIMMSVNKDQPRMQTAIATRAGSKNDPADNTGLAHYLEHMLFKGTDKFGSKDFVKEKVQLDKIDSLYEVYNHSSDPAQRKAIYHAIDSVSGVAATYAIANEYDKLVGAMGATGTNAFTSVEQTVYVNDIPQNQIAKWLEVEGERFRNPILRLFHTELEAVYEEKNIGLDNDDWKVNETVLASLFRNHPYGTQTTIGTVEHLKNPSLKKIRDYFHTYYVPNNMAIILSGDFDPDTVIALIDKNFGGFTPHPLPLFRITPEVPRSAPDVQTVYGPRPEYVQFAFRLPRASTHEGRLLEITDALLSYKGAGLIDLDLNKAQKVLSASTGADMMKDYSVHYFTGRPREGQTLDEVKDLLMTELGRLKKGDFDEAMLQAIITNLKVDRIRQFEGNSARTFTMLDAFILGEEWSNYAARLDELAKITKADVVEFVNKYYTNDYVLIYKKTGEDKNVVKVEKPAITAVEVNRDAQSDFLKKVVAEKTPEIKPVFLDYKKDIAKLTLRNNVPVYYLHNDDNDLFYVAYVLDMGKRNDKKLALAVNYLQYIGSNKYSAEALSKEFFKLACSFSVSAGDDQINVSLSGPEENFEKAVALFEDFLSHPKPDQAALDNLVARELKSRADAKLNKGTILRSALVNYATYGKLNPFTDQLSESELRAIKATELTPYISSLTSYPHKVMYFGPRNKNILTGTLNKLHKTPASFKAYPRAVAYKRMEMNEDVVYFVNYDMVQAEVFWLNKSEIFSAARTPLVSMYNEYFGGGMQGIVFQTIRESKALAYSTFSNYSAPQRKGDPFYIYAYVGTQADKLHDAIPAMNALLNDMPRAEKTFITAKNSLRNQLETERITKSAILYNYLAAQKKGVDHDLRKDVYEHLDALTLDDLEKFHDADYKNKHYAYCIMGSKDRVKTDDLKKYGKVVEVSLEEIFGY